MIRRGSAKRPAAGPTRWCYSVPAISKQTGGACTRAVLRPVRQPRRAGRRYRTHSGPRAIDPDDKRHRTCRERGHSVADAITRALQAIIGLRSPTPARTGPQLRGPGDALLILARCGKQPAIRPTARSRYSRGGRLEGDSRVNADNSGHRAARPGSTPGPATAQELQRATGSTGPDWRSTALSRRHRGCGTCGANRLGKLACGSISYQVVLPGCSMSGAQRAVEAGGQGDGSLSTRSGGARVASDPVL